MKVPAAASLLLALMIPVHGHSGGATTRRTDLPAADEYPGPARGEFLVADTKMFDPRFEKTVILITDSGPGGTVGVIINRPTEMKLAHAFPDIREFDSRPDVVYIGGPVEPTRASILLRSDHPPDGTDPVFENIYFGLEMDSLLRAIREKQTETSVRVYAGYAGWQPGQLENEIRHGWWHVVRADARVLFDMEPSEVWPAMIERSSGEWVGREKGDAEWTAVGAGAGSGPWL